MTLTQLPAPEFDPHIAQFNHNPTLIPIEIRMQITSDLKKKLHPNDRTEFTKVTNVVCHNLPCSKQLWEFRTKRETETLGVNGQDAMCKILHSKKSLIVTFLGVLKDRPDLNDHPISYVDGIIAQDWMALLPDFLQKRNHRAFQED